MKKIFFIAMLSLLGITQLTAQDTGYVPFVREGVKWVCFYFNDGSCPYPNWDMYFQPGRNYFTLELKGDAEYDGQQYKAMHLYSGKDINPEADTVLMYLREQDRIIYALVPEGKTYLEYCIGYCGSNAISNAVQSGEEFILFDFNDPATYYEQMCQRYITQYDKQFEYLGADELSLGQSHSTRHTFKLYGYYELYFIEGIGIDGYHPCCPFTYLNISRPDYALPRFYLSHLEENGNIIYKGINYEYIAPWYGQLPMAREGMKWVNEKVIINHGDTTRYYYTYEIKGDVVCDTYQNAYNIFKQCHYYTGPSIDEKNDSIISLLQDFYPGSEVFDKENHAKEKVIAEDRNLLKYDDEEVGYTNGVGSLYRIIHDDIVSSTATILIFSQKGPRNTWLLNRDNFYRIEDIEIDGHRCNRLVYVDEQGEPLAYLMEGIGFDSRDMGDLLTPFTRRPDPDADYQEYCGLSHVINRDGEIIYKGMRYDEERVKALYYDINGDGIVDVGDVTALIRKVLNNESMTMPGINAVPDVSDVTRLIQYVLTH